MSILLPQHIVGEGLGLGLARLGLGLGLGLGEPQTGESHRLGEKSAANLTHGKKMSKYHNSY